MKRSALQLVGIVIIAFVAGIAVAGYVIPSQGPMFGGYQIRPTILRPTIPGPTVTVATTHLPTLIGPVTAFRPTFSNIAGCDISVSPLLAVFDKSNPSPVTYTVDVKPEPPFAVQPVYLNAQELHGIVSSATFSQGGNQPVAPPFTSTMTIPAPYYDLLRNGPGVYQITIYAAIPYNDYSGWTKVCSENVSLKIQ